MNDSFSAIGAGTAGTVVIVLVLLGTEMTAGFGFHVFDILAGLVGTDSVPLGFVLFFLGGAVLWPLLYITLGQYLPGTGPTRGIVFAAILWFGFAPGFSGATTEAAAPAFAAEGTTLVIYLVVTLLAHLAYGAILGAGHRRLGGSELGSPAV